MNSNSILVVISQKGMGEKIVNDIKSLGVKHGMIFPGKGTIRSKFLKFFELDRVNKDIIFMQINDSNEDKLYKGLEKYTNKKNSAIAFSTPMKNFDFDSMGAAGFSHHLLVVILDKGFSDDCIASAKKAGARGGTIMSGRGAGVPEDFYFPIIVEPQKEIVLIVSESKDVSNIKNQIVKDFDLENPGKGILFILPVSRTQGLYQDRKAETI
ncbi:MAG: hypothetical protein GX219_06715 [Tissierellia bacterium]|nr:hypothetical protein [Tissierellia bacterium]